MARLHERPPLTGILTAEIGGIQWWAGTRQYPNASMAALAFNDLNEYGQRLRGALHVGVYRHGEPDQEKSYITVVGHYEDGVERALRKLGGTPFELHPELLTRLVLRRARVVEAMEGAPAGAYRFPHAGQGVFIGPLGEVEEL